MNPGYPIAFSTANGMYSLDIVDLQNAASVTPGTVLSSVEGLWSVYDGTYPAAGVLADRGVGADALNHWPKAVAVAPSGAAKVIVYARDAELNLDRLIGLDSDAVADLTARGLIVRDFVA